MGRVIDSIEKQIETDVREIRTDVVADFVGKYAANMVSNAPLSIVAAKRVIDEIVKDKEERNPALCERVIADCFGSQDYIEGRRAFMEKRRPVFTGR